MAYFYDPTTSAVAGNVFFRLDFFTTAPDVRSISPLNYDLDCIFANPARHKAKNTPTFSHWRK